jgi:hypothetical protein
LLHVARSRYTLGAVSLAFAVLLGPPLLPLVVPALLLMGLWGVVRIELSVSSVRKVLVAAGAASIAVALMAGSLGIDATPGLGREQLVVALAGLGLIIGSIALRLKPVRIARRTGAVFVAALSLALMLLFLLWLGATGHGLRPYATDRQVSISVAYWAQLSFRAAERLAAASVLSLPFLVGLYKMWTACRDDPDQRSAQIVVLLSLFALLVSFPVFTVIDADHIPLLMWAAFLIPVGWVGLCRLLTDGPYRWGAALAMTIVVATGVVTTVNAYENELRRVPDFLPEQVVALKGACQDETIGYFTPDDSRERHWWFPLESGWVVLAECKMVRLNRANQDMEGRFGQIWQQAAPAAYARDRGIEWQNTPSVMLGFADENGISIVAESQAHPIPADVRTYLQPLQQAGPFMLYRITDVPDS